MDNYPPNPFMTQHAHLPPLAPSNRCIITFSYCSCTFQKVFSHLYFSQICNLNFSLLSFSIKKESPMTISYFTYTHTHPKNWYVLNSYLSCYYITLHHSTQSWPKKRLRRKFATFDMHLGLSTEWISLITKYS